MGGGDEHTSTTETLETRKRIIENELKKVERQIYDLETAYLNDTAGFGNVVHGFDDLLKAQPKSRANSRPRIYNNERIFSKSSSSATASDN